MTSDDRSTETGAIMPDVVGSDDAGTKVEPPETAVIASDRGPAPVPPTTSPAVAIANPPQVPAGMSARPARPPVRVGTIVWGLVVVTSGVLVLAIAAGAKIDSGLALIGLLAGSGIALLVGALVASVRRRDRH